MTPGQRTAKMWEDRGVEEKEALAFEVSRHIHQILRLLGEGAPDKPVSLRGGMEETPTRVGKMYVNELFSGIDVDLKTALNTTFDAEEGMDQMVVVQGITFYSLCEHHLLPFFGEAHVGYIPGKKIVGLSKIPRLVRLASAQPQVQERLTAQIVGALDEVLEPRGAIVVLKARHLCMEMRGVHAPGTFTTTSALRGCLLDDKDQSRSEFLSLIQK
jgi:GTP cyclohydrolase I